jgi:hypothetical protein
MPYEQDKDVLVKAIGPIDDTDLIGELRQYDGGEAKLAVFRVYGKNKDKRSQVFRLPLNEITHLGEYLMDFTATHGTGIPEVEDNPDSTKEESWTDVNF